MFFEPGTRFFDEHAPADLQDFANQIGAADQAQR